MRGALPVSVFALWVALVLCAPPASAQSAAEKREAKVQIATGLDHYRAGEFREAVAAFRRAYELLPDAESTLTWNIARSYEELGDVTNAVHYFEVFLRRYPEDPSLEEGRKRLGKLRQRLPGTLIVQCGDGRAAVVVVDGDREGACGMKIQNLPPGEHPVVVRWGKRVWSSTADIPPAGEVTVEVDWSKARSTAPKVAAPAQRKPRPKAKAAAPARGSAGPDGGDWLLVGGVVVGALAVGAGAAYLIVQPGRVEVPSTSLGERTVLQD